MNKTLQFSKYKLHDRSFNTACSEVYSEILADMSLILILLQNDPPRPPPPPPPPCKLLPWSEEDISLSLMTTSKLRMNLYMTAIEIYSGKSTQLPNERNIEYAIKNQLLQMVESQLSHIVNALHLSFSQAYFQSLKSHGL